MENIKTTHDETHLSLRVTKKQKEKIDAAAKKRGITPSEYIRQRALGSEPKVMLPDTFFGCCEKLDRLTRAPYAKDVNDAALAVLIEMKGILTGKATIPTEKEIAVTEPEPQKQEPKPKRKLFWRR